MTPLDYEFLRKLLKERSGLDLSADKQYLVESRLISAGAPGWLAGHWRTRAETESGIDGGADGGGGRSDDHQRNLLLPRQDPVRSPARNDAAGAIASARQPPRFANWCAASSTGQEPYSIAMCLKELGATLSGWRVEILATDLSQGVLEKSRSGLFSQFEVQRGLPI